MDTVSENLVTEVTRRLVEEIEPQQIFLFGSHAWGSPTQDSDLDMLVVIPDGKGSIRSLKQRARKCLRDILVPMDIVIEPASVFNRRRNVYASLECRIAESGRKLYG